MRETRTSGSEGGGTLTRPPYPYPGFMGPALDKEAPNLPKLWAGSVRGG